MISDNFSHVRCWIFDLDNTLYPPSATLFSQIEVKMTDWVVRELSVDRATADKMRREYWAEYGTTLSGMMAHHDTDPLPYLTYVHDIDFSCLTQDIPLKTAITRLPGRKIIYTNGSEPYAQKVLTARGLSGIFDAVYGIEHADFHPKPQAQAYAHVIARDGINPQQAAMFEDDPRNLQVPYDLGMRTVYVAPTPAPAPHIHHHTSDLADFLDRLQK